MVMHPLITLGYVFITLVNQLISPGSVPDITLARLLACCSLASFLIIRVGNVE